MKRIFTFSVLFFCLFKSFGVDYDKLSNDLIEWKKDCYAQSNQNSFSSQINFYTVKFDEILSNGPEIASFMMQKFKEGNGELIIFFPKLFKVTFDSYFDGRKKVWIFPDYPQYIYYPTGFHPNKQNEDAGSIWSYWWNNGRRLTINIFEKKYKAFQIAKKADKDDDIKQAYIKLQNMGIIILPNLLKKIEIGDTDLIPMFCYLSDQKDLKTADDCKRWWKTNKEKYKDILVESESLCTFDSD